MSNVCTNVSKALAAVIITAAMAGCVTHGPGGVAYSTGDGTRNVGARNDVGATGTPAAGGALSGSMAPAEPQGEKEQRGNTPPGISRDGAKPAEGAIADPTGAATRGKPY